MLSRDYRDMIGGGLLALLGTGFAVHAATQYPLGSLTRMGPGMFPAGAGALLCLLGLVIAVTAAFRTGDVPEFRPRPLLAVLCAVGGFALVVGPFGLLPAVAAATLISSFADASLRPLPVLLLAASLCLASWLIFDLGLGLSISPLRWPF